MVETFESHSGLAQLRALADAIESLRADIEQITAEAVRLDGALTVRADSSGTPTAIELDSRAYRTPAADLGPLLLEALREAADSAHRQQGDLLAPVLREQSGGAVLAELEDQLTRLAERWSG